MPARRPGVRAQKSASQRLCACSPAQRSSRSSASAGGVCVTERATGEERRDRVREDHLGDDAVGLEVAHAAGRSPSCACPRSPSRSANRIS